MLKKQERLEEQESQKRPGKRQLKDEEKEGNTQEQKEAGGSKSAPNSEVISNMKTWYKRKQEKKFTKATSPYEEERIIQTGGKKVYLCTLKIHFLKVSLAFWSYRVNN